MTNTFVDNATNSLINSLPCIYMYLIRHCW